MSDANDHKTSDSKSIKGSMRLDRNKVVPDESWPVIRSLIEAGADVKETATRYGIQPCTIHKKATQQRWATPNRVLAAARKSEMIAGDPASSVAALWKERQTNAREMMFQGTNKALQRFFAMAPVPQSFSEAAIAEKMLNKSIDPESDSEQRGGVNISILATQGFMPKVTDTTVDV